MSLLIKNAKLISKNYEKLYWSIDEKSSNILKRNGCNVKTVQNPKYGTSYNISTKAVSDALCVLYQSLTKAVLEEHCFYDIVIQITTYDYMGKSGKSMTSYIRKKTKEKTITLNTDIVRLLAPRTETDSEEEEEELETELADEEEVEVEQKEDKSVESHRRHPIGGSRTLRKLF